MIPSLGQTIRPPSGTKEWAVHNLNIQDGCEHDCLYCYAKAMAIRFKRSTSETWKQPRIRTYTLSRNFMNRPGRTMFPTAHDITENNLEACIEVLVRLLKAGNEVLIVSKPNVFCISRLASVLYPFRERVLFRFSIGSINNSVLSKWEPGAPSYIERLASLKWAYESNFRTSVSGEPILDNDPDSLVAAVRPYVTDSIWLGKINRLCHILPVNCPGDDDIILAGKTLTASQSDKNLRALYYRLKQDPLVKWKDSIKAVLKLRRPVQPGLDV